MIEDRLPLLRCELVAKLIVHERKFAPETKARLVVVIDVGRTNNRAVLPIRVKMPGARFQQEILRLVQMLLLTGNDPDQRCRFGDGSDSATNVLDVSPFVSFVGITVLWIRITVSHRLVGKGKREILSVKVRLDSRERIRAIARCAIGAEILLPAFNYHRSWRP